MMKRITPQLDRPLRVLIMASGTPHSSLTHRAVAFGGELVKRGHSVTMIAPRRDRHSNWELDQPATIAGIKVIYPFQFSSHNYVLNLSPYMASVVYHVLRTRADVIYIYKPTPLSVVGLVAKLFKRTPVVLDLDDLGSEVMKIEGRSGLTYKLVAWCERVSARFADGIVVTSRLLQRELGELYPAKDVLLLSNGVDPERFMPRTGVAARAPKIIFFGLLGSKRVVLPLLEALPRVKAALGTKRVKLEILGDGPYRAELERETARLGLTSNVKFRGWVQLDDFAGHTAPGDIAICVTPDERTMAAASNQKVFQYQALGLATIVSAVGDLPLYAAGGETAEVVATNEPEALAEVLIKLLDDPERRMALGASGRVQAEQLYSWNVLGLRLEDFLLEIVK